MSERAFVIGGLGFLGTHLVNRLITDGLEVFLYDRKVNPDDSRVGYYRGDVLDASALTRAMRMTEPSVVFHLAALADVRNALKNPVEQRRLNFCATANVLEAMRAADVKRIAFTSSAVVYGDTKCPMSTFVPDPPLPMLIPESGFCFPKQTSIYGAMKLASEALIEAYCEGYGMGADIFRLVSAVGPGYRHGNLFDFYQRLKADPMQIKILGNPRQQKYYIVVGDVIDAMMRTTRSDHVGAEIWNVSHDQPNTIADSIDAVCESLKIQPQRITDGTPWTGDLPTLVLDCSKLRRLGWAPRGGITAAMRETVAYFVEHNL